MKKSLDTKIIEKYSTQSIAVGATTYLEGNWKKKYENFFGVNLPNIKIHKDTNSVQKSRKYNAHSYTQGKNIYLGKDTKSLESIDGQSLLAHEITHILQQDSLDFSQRQGIDKDTLLEAKARIVEDRVLEKRGIEESSYDYFKKWDILPQKILNNKITKHNDVVQRLKLVDLKRVQKNYNTIVLKNKEDINVHKDGHEQTIKYKNKEYTTKISSGIQNTQLYAQVSLPSSTPKGGNDHYYRIMANRTIAQNKQAQQEIREKFGQNLVYDGKHNPYYIDQNGKKVRLVWHHSPNHIGTVSLIKKEIHQKNHKQLHLEDGRGGQSLFNVNARKTTKSSFVDDKIKKFKKFAYRDESDIKKQASKYAKGNIKNNKSGQKTDKIIDLEKDFISNTQDFSDNKLSGSLSLLSNGLAFMSLNNDGRTKKAKNYKTASELSSEGAEAVGLYYQYQDMDKTTSNYLRFGASTLGVLDKVTHTTKLDKKVKFLNHKNFVKAENGLTAGADIAGGISGIRDFAQSKDKKWSKFFDASSELTKGLGEGAKFLKRDMGLNVKGSKTLGHLSNNLEKIGTTLAFVENTSAFIKDLKQGKVDANGVLNLAGSAVNTAKALADTNIAKKAMDKLPFLKKFGFIAKVITFLQGANSILSSEILVTPIKFATAVATSIGSFVGNIANKVGGKVIASMVASMTAGVGALLYPVVSYFGGMLVESGVGILYNKYAKSPIISKLATIHQAILDKGQEIPIVNFFMPLFSADYTGFFKNFMSVIQPKAMFDFIDNYMESKFPIVWKGIKYGAQAVASGISTAVKATSTAISNTYTATKNGVLSGINLVNKVTSGAVALGKKVVTSVMAVGTKVASGAVALGKKAVTSVMAVGTKVASNIKQNVKNIGSGVANFVSGFFGKKEEKNPVYKNISNTVATKYVVANNVNQKVINVATNSVKPVQQVVQQKPVQQVIQQKPVQQVIQQKPVQQVIQQKPVQQPAKKSWFSFATTNRHQVHQTTFEQNANNHFDITSIENKLDEWAEKIFYDMKKQMQLDYIRTGRN